MKNILEINEIANLILSPVKKICNEAVKCLNLVPIHDSIFEDPQSNSEKNSDIYSNNSIEIKNNFDKKNIHPSSYFPNNEKYFIENYNKENEAIDEIILDNTSTLQKHKIKGFAPVFRINQSNSEHEQPHQEHTFIQVTQKDNKTSILSDRAHKDSDSPYISEQDYTSENEQRDNRIDKKNIQSFISNWVDKNITDEKPVTSFFHINLNNYSSKTSNLLNQYKPFINNDCPISMNPPSETISDSMHILQDFNVRNSSRFNFNNVTNMIPKTVNSTNSKDNNSSTLKIDKVDKEELKEVLLELLLDEAHNQGVEVL